MDELERVRRFREAVPAGEPEARERARVALLASLSSAVDERPSRRGRRRATLGVAVAAVALAGIAAGSAFGLGERLRDLIAGRPSPVARRRATRRRGDHRENHSSVQRRSARRSRAGARRPGDRDDRRPGRALDGADGRWPGLLLRRGRPPERADGEAGRPQSLHAAPVAQRPHRLGSQQDRRRRALALGPRRPPGRERRLTVVALARR